MATATSAPTAPKKLEKAQIKLQDKPMTCCGMVMGYGITENVPNGVAFNQWLGRDLAIMRAANQTDIEDRLTQLIKASQDDERNCAMITLSEDQRLAKEIAERLGFKVIQEFFNPNSGNKVWIMTHLNYDSVEDWRASNRGDDDEENW